MDRVPVGVRAADARGLKSVLVGVEEGEMKETQVEFALRLLRENPEGVTSLFLTQNKLGIYHKFSSRCSDLKKQGFVIVCEREKSEGPEWNYRWKLINPEHLGEFKPPEPKLYFNQNGQQEILWDQL